MIDPHLARRIALVGLDVDGVLTDGGIYLGAVGGSALEFKRYDIQDGLGVRFLRMAGLKVVIVTGRESESVRLRAQELDIEELDLVQDRDARKLPAFRRLLARHAVAPEEAAFIGDDFPDMGVLRIVGLPVAVANAVPEVRAVAAMQLDREGGRGAVREFAERLLRARGVWDEITERYVAERGVEPARAGA